MHYWRLLIPVLAVIGAVVSYSQRIDVNERKQCLDRKVRNYPLDPLKYRDNFELCKSYRQRETSQDRRNDINRERVRNEVSRREIGPISQVSFRDSLSRVTRGRDQSNEGRFRQNSQRLLKSTTFDGHRRSSNRDKLRGSRSMRTRSQNEQGRELPDLEIPNRQIRRSSENQGKGDGSTRIQNFNTIQRVSIRKNDRQSGNDIEAELIKNTRHSVRQNTGERNDNNARMDKRERTSRDNNNELRMISQSTMDTLRKVRDSRLTKMGMRMSRTRSTDNFEAERRNVRLSDSHDERRDSEDRLLDKTPSGRSSQIRSTRDDRTRFTQSELPLNRHHIEENVSAGKERFNDRNNQYRRLQQDSRLHGNRDSLPKIRQSSIEYVRLDDKRQGYRVTERSMLEETVAKTRESRENRIYSTRQNVPTSNRFRVKSEHREIQRATERREPKSREVEMNRRSVQESMHDRTASIRAERITENVNHSEMFNRNLAMLYTLQGLYMIAVLYKLFGKKGKYIVNDNRPQWWQDHPTKAIKVD